MATISEHRLFLALATLTHAFSEGALPTAPGEGAAPPEGAPAGLPGESAGATDASATLAGMDKEAREALGEAALAVAFGAFAASGGEAGPMQALLAAMGLMAALADEEPDPPAEVLGIAAEDARVEDEIDRAGEALDAEFGRDATVEAVTAALEARILGTAITLAGCTLPEGVEGPTAVRLRAARCLTRLAAGLLAMNAVAGGAAGAPLPAQPEGGSGSA
ncbi:MAG: hypothetical protein IRZ13_13685 [Acetobacteraceae bacterium]|nr:hypothetical protein [Acetobacteraceae bacterium]